MSKILFVLSFLNLGILNSISELVAQKHDQNWVIGYDVQFGLHNNYIDFSQKPVKAISRESKLKFGLSLNVSFSDENGNFLFYSDGCRIFDSSNNLVENGDSINAGVVADAYYNYGYPINQGGLVLPSPNTKNEFDFITVLIESTKMYGGHPIKLLNHHIIIDKNNKLSVSIKNQTILQDTFSNSDLVACKHANGEDWWILLPKIQSNGYYIILLDKEGFHTKGIQNIGPIYNYVSDWSGQSVFSLDGTKYARYDRGNEISIFDFDRSSGILSNPVHMDIIDSADSLFIGCGLSFSPNSRYLYAASTLSIYQFDMLSTSILDSKLTVAQYDGFLDPFPSCFFLMQLAPDDKIYICSAYSNHNLHVITNPNQGGIACDVKQHSLSLPHNLIGALPFYPNYRLGKSSVGVIDTLKESKDDLVTLYPNPVVDQVTVEIKSNISDVEIILLDALGRKVFQKKLSDKKQFDISSLQASLYLYKIIHAGTIISSGKLIKL